MSKHDLQIRIGTPAHAYLSAMTVLDAIENAGVVTPSVILYGDGSGQFTIPLIHPNDKLSATDWRKLVKLITDSPLGETLSEGIGKMEYIPSFSSVTSQITNVGQGVKDKAQRIEVKEIRITFTYSMRNYRGHWRLSDPEALGLKFNAEEWHEKEGGNGKDTGGN